MLPPLGFLKPLWRGWEESGAVRTDLAVAVASIKRSIGGCHQEEVRREETNVPSSNQHHYGQKPTRFEVDLVPTTRQRDNKGIVKVRKKCKLQHFINSRYPQVRGNESPDVNAVCCSVQFIC